MHKRALLSVSDKTGITTFAKGLQALGYEIISTGGTYEVLKTAGVDVTKVSEVTDFPEMLQGRVKTLHPNIHAGILAKRDDSKHIEDLNKHAIAMIDVVCVNLYPFKETIQKENVTLSEAVEQIDIGGPSMLRAAAKNYADVYAVVDPADYQGVLNDISGQRESTFKYQLAAKVFRYTAQYDSLISNYLTTEEFPKQLTTSYRFKQALRYGENPHQKAAFYESDLPVSFSITAAKQLHGKEMSYNNIKDANAAIMIAKEFTEPCVVAMKHMNPCGVGIGATIFEAWEKAYASDPISIFGGIIAVNRVVDLQTAEKMSTIFLEIIIAPKFSKEAYELLSKKKNIRLFELDFNAENTDNYEYISILGGLLVQEIDKKVDQLADLKVVTDKQPTPAEQSAMLFAQNIVKHVKSNAIVIATNDQTLGIGAGQMNRIGSVEIAISQALKQEDHSPLVMASDAFFPMDDCVKYAAEHGVTAIIQPGGSIKDQDSIDMANKFGIAMVFTGHRHFKH